MNFMFEWQEQYLTSERSEQVRYCFSHENIKFISSSQRVMFFLLYGEINSTKAKGGNRDVIHCKMKRANLAPKMEPKRVSPEWYCF